MDKLQMESAIDISQTRRYLHRHPETAGEEEKTSEYVKKWIADRFEGFEIQEHIGGHGLVASKTYGSGSHIALRAELDALPVLEENRFEHRSAIEGKSHACGHDGHMSMVLRAAEIIDSAQPEHGTLSLLFQPAEETGQGARWMLEDPNFDHFQPDALYALHNIPGKPLGTVLSRSGTFACGSVGVRIELHGKTAHAAHPEDAINPILLSQDFIKDVTALASRAKGFALVTPIALRAGEKTFGTTPLKSIVLLTMRAELSEDLEFMMKETRTCARRLSDIKGVHGDLRFEEYFPVTRNEKFHTEVVAACNHLSVPFEEMEVPFRWSEDFGHFTERCPTHMFGLGSGVDTAPLHASTYDFPDELIDKGAEVFARLFYQHHSK